MVFLNILIVRFQNLPDFMMKEKADFEPAFSFYFLESADVFHKMEM